MNKMSVLELNEIKSWMKLQLELQVKWIDPRMKFANMKEEEERNILSSEQKQKLFKCMIIKMLLQWTVKQQDQIYHSLSVLRANKCQTGILRHCGFHF